jgi:hypothetical protein
MFYEKTLPIPIGLHWMILWPFDAAIYGLPTTLRQGSVDDCRYPLRIHICGSPWEGNEYKPDKPTIWTMS